MNTGVAICKFNLADRTVKVLKGDSLLGQDMIMPESGGNIEIASWFGLVHLEDRRMVSDRLSAEYVNIALKSAGSFELRFRMVRNSGSSTVQCSVSRADEDNCVFMILEDISARQEEMEENEKKTQTINRLVDRLAASYKILHLVNLNTDTYTTLKMDDGVIGKGLELSSFSSATSFFVNQVVFEKDRQFVSHELDLDTVRDRLVERKSYSVEFRTLIGESTMWNAMVVTQISDDVAAIGFVDHDLELVTDCLKRKIIDKFCALFVVDTDTGLLKVVKGTDIFSIGTIGESVSYSEAFGKFAGANEGEVKEFFSKLSDLDYLKMLFENDDRKSYSYKSSTTGGEQWVTMSLYVLSRHDDGSAAVISMGFSLMDALGRDRLEIQGQLESALAMTRSVNLQLSEHKHLLDYFLRTYDSAYYVDLIEQSIQVLHMDHIFSEFMNLTGNLADMADFINNHVHPDDREFVFKIGDKDYVSARIRKEGHFTFQIREVHGGMKRTFRGHVIKGTDECHVLVAFMDISEELRREKQQQEQLQQALSMAQSANRAKTTFLNNMSHDIRTPMNAIIGYTGLALSHIDRIDLVGDYLDKISRSSNHLLSLINDVLDMSRIESGKVNIEVQPENLSDIIHYLSDVMQQGAQSKQQDFHVKAIDIRHENVVCDKLRLNQILINLLSNAVKYTPQRGSVTMRVREMPSKKLGFATYEFTVHDTGIGMSDEFLQVIFDPFTRDKSSTVSGIQGTGLGMAITKNLVDLMDGRIRITSELGKGTEATVTFDFKLQSEKSSTVEISELKDMRVLVVNNDSLNYKSISNMLSSMGMSSEWSISGMDAMKRVDKLLASGKLFDAYIIDRLLSDIEGVELTRSICQKVNNNPIFILTAYDWQDIEVDALKAGVNGFIAKPVFQSDLLGVFEKFLQKDSDKVVNDDGADVVEDKFDISGRRILLVEDNELNREIATAILEEYGCIITAVDDGDVAVEKMAAAHPGDWDIVLMDIQMPRLNGYDATRQIRALGTEISKIPIIAMTANAFEEDRRKAIEAGMNEHFAKPIDIAKLKVLLKRFLS